MRTTSTVVTAALLCVVTGAALAGCSDDAAPPEPSAGELLDRANETMKALTSVTVDWTHTGVATGARQTGRMTTDLKDTCTSRVTWTNSGTYEQIRLGDTAYARVDRASLKGPERETTSPRTARPGKPDLWRKAPVDKETAEDGPTACTREFASFGTAVKGGRTKVGDTPAVPLVVNDKAEEGGTYTFYVATEGEPYILKVDYKGPTHRTTTTFSAFDRPLDVRPPADADVLVAAPAGD
ncbi:MULTISPECIES: hypothetical protein [unclassified Streptomyces]|uniref:hypothetical protein n=1 Tax=unclassified Streptomyces TaxID=2593676 RepID=UPI00344F1804